MRYLLDLFSLVWRYKFFLVFFVVMASDNLLFSRGISAFGTASFLAILNLMLGIDFEFFVDHLREKWAIHLEERLKSLKLKKERANFIAVHEKQILGSALFHFVRVKNTTEIQKQDVAANATKGSPSWPPIWKYKWLICSLLFIAAFLAEGVGPELDVYAISTGAAFCLLILVGTASVDFIFWQGILINQSDRLFVERSQNIKDRNLGEKFGKIWRQKIRAKACQEYLGWLNAIKK